MDALRPAGEVLDGFLQLPRTARDEELGESLLILAPHPDDESLGCGGLIAAACAAGRPPLVTILTDGAASHPGSRAYPPRHLAALRRQEARRALQILGLTADRVIFLDFADGAMARSGQRFETAAARLAELAVTQNCGAVVGPWGADPHCDHEAGAALAAAVAARAGLKLFSYPVWGWLLPRDAPLAEPRRGGWRLDISAWLPLKARAIAAHESQYGALITDSPQGFRLPPALLDIFRRPFEVFIAP